MSYESTYESTHGKQRRDHDNGGIGKYLTGWPSDVEAGKTTDGSLKRYLPEETENDR